MPSISVWLPNRLYRLVERIRTVQAEQGNVMSRSKVVQDLLEAAIKLRRQGVLEVWQP